ncbi:MAG: helix-turn-helix domain-containing protein [Candidatus Melainabacteria bacterium]|nr:helix-turn-helix domain-containing protein [Candidatus Melainabacteria bacterium]
MDSSSHFSASAPQKPQLPQETLPETLAQRIQHLREQRGVTQQRLAHLANVPVQLIEELESGVELFLSTASRLKLARALRVRPGILKEVEVSSQPAIQVDSAYNHEVSSAFGQASTLPFEAMATNPKGFWPCPACGGALQIALRDREDLRHHPIVVLKARCTECLFRWEHELVEP